MGNANATHEISTSTIELWTKLWAKLVDELDAQHFKEDTRRVFISLAIFSVVANAIVIIANEFFLDERTKFRNSTSLVCLGDAVTKLCQLWGYLFISPNASNSDVAQACQIQAFVLDVFATATFIYQACFTLLVTATCFQKPYLMRKAEQLHYWMPWTMAVSLPCVTSVRELYAPQPPQDSTGWCWVQSGLPWGKYIFTSVLWEHVSQATIVLCYSAIVVKTLAAKISRRRRNFHQLPESGGNDSSDYKKGLHATFGNLMFLPPLFTLCFLPGSTWLSIVDHNTELPLSLKQHVVQRNWRTFYLLNGIGRNSTGVVSCLLFIILTRHTRRHCKYIVKKLCAKRELDAIFGRSQSDSLFMASKENKNLTSINSDVLDNFMGTSDTRSRDRIKINSSLWSRSNYFEALK